MHWSAIFFMAQRFLSFRINMILSKKSTFYDCIKRVCAHYDIYRSQLSELSNRVSEHELRESASEIIEIQQGNIKNHYSPVTW